MDRERSAQATGQLHPLDAMTAAPGHHDIILENAQVRMLDTKLGPGERTPVYAHQWPGALYILSWSDFVRRDADGNILVDSRDWEKRPAKGEGLWSMPLIPHSVENVGDQDLHIIAVELKDA